MINFCVPDKKEHVFMGEVVLAIDNLKTYFRVKEGLVRAVDGVSYQIHRAETLGLVGESGCGKTVSSLSILKLLDMPPAEFHGGKILFENQDLLTFSEKQMRDIRGKSISMIFQEPMTSLNPMLSIGFQVGEVLMQHKRLTAGQVRSRTVELLEMVGIPSPEKRIAEYPHQLSGGMRQRVMIALALACNPKVLIADEPTTALDVTIQAQILELMVDLQDNLGTSILLITHDLGVIAETAHRVAVMYAGKIVEEADVVTIFKNPLHPYTQGLMNSVPRIDEAGNSRRLEEIPGMVPNLYNLPEGCSFFDRCPTANEKCRTTRSRLLEVDSGHTVRCWKTQKG
jgi:peptide/nickel transport system ATP-binding protein/oligopeptide transport system ATP-binding protein